MVRRRGASAFSLIESAIVLSVVGLIVGGIWAAAANVQEKRQVQLTVTGIGFMVDQLRTTFKGFSESSVNTGPFDANFFLPFPDGFSKRVTSGCCTSNDLVDPFGHITYLEVPVIAWTGGTPALAFNFYSVAKEKCTQLAMGLANIPGLRQISIINGGGNRTISMPVTFSSASINCGFYAPPLHLEVQFYVFK